MEDRGLRVAIFDLSSSILDLLSFLIAGSTLAGFDPFVFTRTFFKD